ncbi:MAG: signal peptidase I [Patescibacteria group bacterium]|jgi:signal peptidase I
MSVKKFILEMLETFFSSAVVLFVIYMWIAMPELVFGASMEPNFHTGQRILVEKVTKHFKDFERGEVVVLNPPGNDNIDYIKRVIGLPGDVVKIKDCGVYIYTDGKGYKLQEDYLTDGICTTDGPSMKEGRSVRIEDGYYFVLGDNRTESADSRVFGLVKADRMLGRVVFRFWPIDKAGLL